MNRSLLRMRCLNVGDVLGWESPAHLESVPYYVFMKEQWDWRFIIGLDERDLHFTTDEVSVRWKCVCRFTVKHHHPNIGLCKLLKNSNQSHKCIFSLGIKVLLRTNLIWMFFYLALAKLVLHPLVVKFNILKCSLLLNVVLVCLSVRALQALIQSLDFILD